MRVKCCGRNRFARNRLRFATADENVIAKWRHGARQLVEIVVRVVEGQKVYQANDVVECLYVILCPVKDQAFRCRSPQPRRRHANPDQILWARRLYLANHFFLHLSRIALRLHELVNVNVACGRVPLCGLALHRFFNETKDYSPQWPGKQHKREDLLALS
jgi:hypothetical protein